MVGAAGHTIDGSGPASRSEHDPERLWRYLSGHQRDALLAIATLAGKSDDDYAARRHVRDLLEEHYDERFAQRRLEQIVQTLELKGLVTEERSGSWRHWTPTDRGVRALEIAHDRFEAALEVIDA